MIKPIGGYFELELSKKKEYHKNAIKLNCARNALEYILKANNYAKIYLPYYTCDVLLQPITRLKIEYEFYKIDKNLEPELNKKLNKEEVILLTNYFGIKNNIPHKFKNTYKNIIVDNSQAFFNKPYESIDTYYSPRKFFGLPDGAYLYTKNRLNIRLPIDHSLERFKHLIKRIDLSPQEGYSDFKDSDQSLNNNPIRLMSKLTRKLLLSIDYKYVVNKRTDNFLFLHKSLSFINKLKIDIDEIVCPLVYPLLVYNNELKKRLIDNNIFVATYWENVLTWVKKNSFETDLVKYLVPLPIDQRYGLHEMKHIVKKIINHIKV